MPDVLAWTHDLKVTNAIHEGHLERAVLSLDVLISRLGKAHGELAQALRDEAGRASAAACRRVLLAPEVTYRLMWRAESAASPLVTEAAGFVLHAFQAERVLEGATVPGLEGWTGLGDARILPG